jgi:hypothetical protein
LRILFNCNKRILIVSTKNIMTALAVGSALLAGAAHADTVAPNIELTATVPSDTFYVKALGGWPTSAVTINWDDVGQKLLDPQPIQLQLRNNIASGKEGKINAKLAIPAVLTDNNPADDIPLEVTISSASVKGPTALDTTPQPIYDNKTGDMEAGVLRIHAKPASTPNAGTYKGLVSLVFESAV